MSSSRYRLVLVDNHPLFMVALAHRLSREPDMEIVGTAEDTASGLRAIQEHKPDLAVVQLEIPGRGAFNLAEDIAARVPAARILLWGEHFSDILLDEALRIRVAGCLLTRDPIDRVVCAFRAACQGETVFSAEIAERLEFDREAGRYTARYHGKLSTLTTRQLTVLRHLIRGESVKDVARTMALSERAIESHKYRIMRRLGIHDRVELARYAIREGLAVP